MKCKAGEVMQYKGCAFSGHRVIADADIKKIYDTLKPMLIELIEQGITDFYAGGALGFDTIAALMILKLRGEYPHIKLHLLLPYPEQSEDWSENDIMNYEFTKQHANSFVYLDRQYSAESLRKRNRELVDRSDMLICYCRRPRSGTASTMNYAKKLGKPVINLADKIFAK